MKILATLILTLAASAAMASGCVLFCDPFTGSSIATSATSSSGNFKSILELAQEDAVKFVASNGEGEVSQALRQAIDEINAKLVESNIQAMSDLNAASMIAYVNTINAQK